MKQLFIFIFSFYLTHNIFAQNFEYTEDTLSDTIHTHFTEDDSLKQIGKKDSVFTKHFPLFTEVSLSIDYGKILLLLTDFEDKIESWGQIVIKNKLAIIFGGGYAKLTPKEVYKNTAYFSEGVYYKVGLGYHFSVNNKTDLTLFVKYSATSFHDGGDILIISPSGLYKDYNRSFRRNNLSASSFEIGFLSETKIIKKLYIGFQLMYRHNIYYDKNFFPSIYSIPGYGRSIDRGIPALNLFLKYKFISF